MTDEYQTGFAGPAADPVELAAAIVSSYVSNHQVPTSELGSLIASVHTAVSALRPSSEPPVAHAKLEPAVPVKKSVRDDHIVCLEDGKKFKSLKRHLMTHYGLSPEQYREKWQLPHDYPMVAPSYALARSRLAKEMGLGRKPGYRRPSGGRTAA